MARLTTFVLALAMLAAAGCTGDVTCSQPRDCPVTQRCASGTCADTAASQSALGEACKNDGECAAGLTCSLTTQGYPGGFCTASCSATAPCGSTGTCTAIGSAQICAPSCTTDSACRQGYSCCATLNDACVPAAACPPPQCMRPVVASALQPPGTVQSLGTSVPVGTQLTFTVPPNTGSVTIVQQAEIATLTVVFKNSVIDNSAVPLTITKPDGGIAYDDNADAGSPSPTGAEDQSGHYSFFAGGTPSTAAFTIPNTSASLAEGVPAGDWKFVVNDYAYECARGAGCNDGGTATNTYDVTILTRPLPAAQTGTMGVDFYIVADTTLPGGVLPFNAANAPNDPSVQRMMQTFSGIYADAGITTSINFRDTTAAEKARFGTNISVDATGPCSELSQMFTISGQHPGNTMNLFLVQSLRSAATQGGSVVGVDGTIPGPSSLNGTISSGAVVVAADLFGGTCGATPNVGTCGADKVAFIAAHETGHFLGLVHPTEQEGSDFDPLNDTPKCPCIPCSSAPGSCTGANPSLVTADRCADPPTGSCRGGSNLMFWQLFGGVSQGLITPEQGQVMRLNPLIH